jgi:hypothetical protein
MLGSSVYIYGYQAGERGLPRLQASMSQQAGTLPCSDVELIEVPAATRETRPVTNPNEAFQRSGCVLSHQFLPPL